jgi:hypothetical protein
MRLRLIATAAAIVLVTLAGCSQRPVDQPGLPPDLGGAPPAVANVSSSALVGPWRCAVTGGPSAETIQLQLNATGRGDSSVELTGPEPGGSEGGNYPFVWRLDDGDLVLTEGGVITAGGTNVQLGLDQDSVPTQIVNNVLDRVLRVVPDAGERRLTVTSVAADRMVLQTESAGAAPPTDETLTCTRIGA